MDFSEGSRMKSAMNYGLITGIALVIISLVFWMIGSTSDKIENYIGYLVLIGGIAVGIKNHRDTDQNGLISYGGALGMGTLISFFAAVLLGLYMYAFTKWIDPGIIDMILALQEAELEDAGQTQKEIEKSMNIVKMFITPLGISIISMIVYTFVGFVISLIASIFLKKTDDSFDANFQ